MVSVSYVYPNVSAIPQRGSLAARWQLAKSMKCDYVEVPADFIKNKSEMNKTGLDLGCFLTEKSIRELYEKDSDVPKELKYVLHTEPSLLRRDSYGIAHQAPLKWYDGEWRNQFSRMVLSLSRFFCKPTEVIEIHPGDRRNSPEDIAISVELLLDKYSVEFTAKPLVLLENRTGQLVSSGREILHFWEFISDEFPHLKDGFGIVLDIQQLYTVTKDDFLKELEVIPLEAVRGFHIHYRHRVPCTTDEIRWKHVFSRIASMKGHVIINPEILHKNKVKNAIAFCRSMLSAFA